MSDVDRFNAIIEEYAKGAPPRATASWYIFREALVDIVGSCARSTHAGTVDIGAWLLEQVRIARDALQEYKDELERVVEDRGPGDEQHCSCCCKLRVEVKRLRAEKESA